MQGKNAGVFALLKKQPSLIAVHCSAHRLELCYMDGHHTAYWFILHVLKHPTEQN